MVGLPGAGKTTRARQLAAEHGALRLTPDDWMIPLFGEAEADGKRDVLEGRMLWLALEAVKLGTNVVVDYGCWSRDERSAIRWLVEAEEACFRMVYLPVEDETQRARIAHRWATTPRRRCLCPRPTSFTGARILRSPTRRSWRAAGSPARRPAGSTGGSGPLTGGRRSRDGCGPRQLSRAERACTSPK